VKKLVVLSMVCVILAGAVGLLDAAPRGRWRLIGERAVTDRVDHDVITVTRTRGQWNAIKIMVHKHAVQFRSVKVIYANGTVQDIELRNVIPAGGESRVIDLRGSDRTIQRIEMVYDAQSLGGQALVKVFGRR
jgi:hypothetical protein